ncbi:MAG: hypothetical protein ACK54X_23550 [Burkholderiales bacterium]
MRSTAPGRRGTLGALGALGAAALAGVLPSVTARAATGEPATRVPATEPAARPPAAEPAPRAAPTAPGSRPARPPRIEPLALDGWPALRASLPRPSVLVFTTTWCANCPETFEAIRAELRGRRLGAPMVAVVIDGDALGRGLRDERVAHLAHSSRVLAFSGHEAALRHAVDPSWRGVVPWVGLVGADGSVGFAAGTPSAARLDAWSARR